MPNDDSPLVIDLAQRDPLAAPAPEDPQDLSGREPYDPSTDQADLDNAQRARERSLGETVASGQVAPQWTTPMEAFLSSEAMIIPSAPITLERPASNWSVTLTVTTVPTPRYNKVAEAYTTWKRDQRTGEREQITDDRGLKCAFVIEGLKEIDFNDPKLWERYGASDPHHLVERMFLKGEIDRIVNMVAQLSGFRIDDLEAEAGNS